MYQIIQPQIVVAKIAKVEEDINRPSYVRITIAPPDEIHPWINFSVPFARGENVERGTYLALVLEGQVFKAPDGVTRNYMRVLEWKVLSEERALELAPNLRQVRSGTKVLDALGL